MTKTNQQKNTIEEERENFTTIDDLLTLSEELNTGLKKIAQYKHPLKVRRGSRKEVTLMEEQQELSKTLKAGKKTYFFDIKESKSGKPYLMITESWFKTDKDDEEPERNNIIVFPEQAHNFAFITTVMLAKIVKE